MKVFIALLATAAMLIAAASSVFLYVGDNAGNGSTAGVSAASQNALAEHNTPQSVQRGVGTITKVARELGAVRIAHDPVPSLGWPAMTMTFAVRDTRLMDKLEEGDEVEFEFVRSGESYVITAVK